MITSTVHLWWTMASEIFKYGLLLVLGCGFITPHLLPAQTASAKSETYPIDPALYKAMKWRNIGPFRGGRVTAVTGVINEPQVYYMGSAGGGVWKTSDAGNSWQNISDGFFNTSSVGAIGVAASDPNVIYVGTGEAPVRGVTTSHGDGVYKSTDAGATWTHVGLPETRQISRVQVHPTNPDVVYVAAQGSPFGATEQRGIYRTVNGGKDWEKVLFVDDDSGASDMSIDMTNPRIMYATFWDHRRYPWKIRSGGPGSSIWKSTDGGDTWAKLNKGLPQQMGKIGVSVSQADNSRVFAIIEAAGDEGGLYRSDDAGKSWKLVNNDRVIRARAWYYMDVTADPVDKETVYVINAPLMKSTDGGATMQEISVPHGDVHDLWINPNDNTNMIDANDGGANISFNQGASWSSQQNQPTAQFYRVNTDNQFPYNVYGGQQDNSTVVIKNRTSGSGIGWKDWFTASGCESSYMAFNPDDPTLIYGGCYQGIIEEYNHETGAQRNIMAYPYLGLGTTPASHDYRFNWNAPIVVSPHNPSVIYHAGNHLLMSANRGQSWQEISPDLTKNKTENLQEGGGPITNEAAGGEIYHTIMYVMPSPHEEGTLWVGTDDGLVHITQNGGDDWTNVTPADIDDAMINAIEVSPHDPATAYIAATRYKFNDFTPRIYKTNNYGQSWKRITEGIPEGAWARVVREDPEREGLLYAGTELGMYISFNDGSDWQPFQNNLPLVPITDLQIRRNDLVAATQGRAFWVLDDLSPLQQLNDDSDADHQLYKPADAYQMGGRQGSEPNQGSNPPDGVLVHYTLAETPDTAQTVVRMDILDAQGAIIRTFAAGNDSLFEHQNKAEETGEALPINEGLNRLVWDFNTSSITPLDDYFVFGSTNGYRVAPGTYTARLSVGDAVSEQSFEVLADPRKKISSEEQAQKQQMVRGAYRTINEMHKGVRVMESIRAQVRERMDRVQQQGEMPAIMAQGKAVDSVATQWIETIVQPRQETFQDVINFPNQLNAQLLYLYGLINSSDLGATEGAQQRLHDLQGQWSERKTAMQHIVDGPVKEFNALFAREQLPAVIIPASYGQ